MLHYGMVDTNCVFTLRFSFQMKKTSMNLFKPRARNAAMHQQFTRTAYRDAK